MPAPATRSLTFGLPLEELRAKAATLTPPAWATHVAVRNDGSKVEPVAWHEDSKAFLDEDPSLLRRGDWAGCIKEAYWVWFPVGQEKKQ